MVRDQLRLREECAEGRPQGGISFVGGSVETIVGRHLLGDLPDAFDRVELG